MYPQLNFNVVLVEPEIPNNTGNIGRTCVGTWSRLNLVGELGFDIDEKQVRRAGLDYWKDLDLVQFESLEQWQASLKDKKRAFYFTTKANRPFFDVDFQPGDSLVFGKETKGLDESFLKENWDQCVTIPFPGMIRSYNLSNAVAMSLGEGLRQFHSKGLIPSKK